MTDIVKAGGDMFRVAEMFAKSGFFTDARDMSQAFVKIMAGAELGIPPFAAMTGIHVIQGKPALGAGVMAGMVKRSGKYDYRIREHTNEVCRIAFFEAGQEVGVSEFTIAEARKAGTKNLDKFPKNMLFARALSNGIKFFAPDLTQSPVYTPDELGAHTDEDGSIIAVPPRCGVVESARTPKKLNRDGALAKIARLGGDVDHAATLDDNELVAYGKELAKSFSSEEEGETGGAIPTELEPETKLDALPTSVMGTILKHEWVARGMRATLDNGVRVLVPRERTLMWAQMVKRGGDGVATLAVQPEERVLFTGKKMKRDGNGNEDEFIADDVTISE